jgi:uncharacterized protein
MIEFPQHAILISFIALIAGLARGFSGFGAALIFMPLASALVGAQVAAPLLLVIDLIFTLPMIRPAFAKVKFQQVMLMTLGAAITVPLGTWLLGNSDPLTLRWMIAALAIAMLVLLVSGWRYADEPRAHYTMLVGALSGLFTGIAQLGGPPVVAYLMGGKNAAAPMRAFFIVFFFATTLLSIASYALRHLFTGDVMRLAVIVGPGYGIGLFAGTRIFGLASEEVFRRVCFLLIAAAVLVSLPIWNS